MSAYRLARGADEDLEQIAAYIGRNNPSAAERVIDALFATLDFVSQQPYIAPERPELRAGLRVVPARKPAQNYIILYEIHIDNILIIAVLHGSRDWMEMIRRGER